eukprot:SAG22_NODE_13834_length_393_cov_1.156463_1_plen_31_part_10
MAGRLVGDKLAKLVLRAQVHALHWLLVPLGG